MWRQEAQNGAFSKILLLEEAGGNTATQGTRSQRASSFYLFLIASRVGVSSIPPNADLRLFSPSLFAKFEDSRWAMFILGITSSAVYIGGRKKHSLMTSS